ncbi:hypothetical protein RJ639_038291 [Escallonia herrerae]|uniref:tRNA (guanosine(18)-2'-O)-methyltransferase TARBP1 n=1 Tax=Escallonia herrerae TaxID=1293975 RepID=A0AA88WM72_9ASTE|nr:hypothetical protein RJ639_038291 [Escallonia herrerae]
MAAHIDSLSVSFRRVPPAAIPAMLDCILASTASLPVTLFSSLLDEFPRLTKDVFDRGEKLDPEQSNYVVSLVSAFCHLLKKSGLFFEVIVETSSWSVVEETMAPYYLRLVGLSLGMLQSEELAIHKWSMQSFQFPDDQLSDLRGDKYSILSHSGSFPLPMSCHILASLLDAVQKSQNVVECNSGILANRCNARIFAENLLWDLCNLTIQMLSQSLEHRSCAIRFLIPPILKAFFCDPAFEISVCGQTYMLSRNNFFRSIWKCCQTLFSQGPIERRDAYAVLSQYLSLYNCINGCDGVNVDDETFDLRTEKEFWDEIRSGLIDVEGLVRKQSLYILKAMVNSSEEDMHDLGFLEQISSSESSDLQGSTKKGRWADKEAKSLGVGKVCNPVDICLSNHQKWAAFFLLYEMLEEYGTHLVEAAWNYQITMLLRISSPCDNSVNPVCGGLHFDQLDTLDKIFEWLAVLWERGLCHDNPQVRCLIMQSFLGIEWKNYGDCAKLVPEDFVLGPFIRGLNDPVHHKDFGLKGVYSSRTIEGASKFLHQYTTYLNVRKQMEFLVNLASLTKTTSFGRAGLMGLAECIASAASGVQGRIANNWEQCKLVPIDKVQVEYVPNNSHNDKAGLLDILRFVIESSKQHFNPYYRLKVCEKVLDSAASVVSVLDVPLELLLHFISTMPRASTDCGGLLRMKLQVWLSACNEEHYTFSCSGTSLQLLTNLVNFPKIFIHHDHAMNALYTYDDEDLDMWGSEAKRWARVLFLVIKEEHHLDPTYMFIQNHGIDIFKQNSHSEWAPIKFLILILSVVQELQVMKERTTRCAIDGHVWPDIVGHLSSTIFGKFANVFTHFLEEVVSFSILSCSIFWSSMVTEDSSRPSAIRGKLGGPSQRRLSASTSTAILQAITSAQTLASILPWCAEYRSDVLLDSAFTFIWQLSWKIITSPSCNTESEAEIRLAAYEALAHVWKAVTAVFSPLAFDLLLENCTSSLPECEGKPLLDSFVQTFLWSINDLIAVGNLVRSRRAVLMNWKWTCLESLLSIPKHALDKGVRLQSCDFFFSNALIRSIFSDLVDSLENAGENSVLPMLRSVRLVLELFAVGRMSSVVFACDGVDTQMMWQLVHSSWILHSSFNKRRVAPIAALLSSVLHSSVFCMEGMHEIDDGPGPLKWLVEKILEEGTRSPRTIRLTALHLTGLWLSNPSTIKYYMKELKLLTLYGSVAFDEDFEAELVENHDARSEVSVLAKCSDTELTKEFINTELYARVSVAVLFYRLADLADMGISANENENTRAAFESGKMFLMELLDAVINDRDLAKELYKKYSAIHRRKIRVWQMICILFRFVDQDIVQKVTSSLHISLYRNNLPSVRQYPETFAIYIYLKFPSLVAEQLVPLLRTYDMRTQALSSYVFVAANVILHATEAVQSRHLNGLLPPLTPLLTSHHHTLRGFTQLLVYQVLSKVLLPLDSSALGTMSLEKRCFVDLKSYLKDNSDCARLRESMEGYLDAFNPKTSITPAGIFTSRVEDLEFECVPTSLMERVIGFLNDVREDLRCSMAKDAASLKNEHLNIDKDPMCLKVSSKANEKELIAQQPADISLDFQKKVTLSKHEIQDTSSGSLWGNKETYKQLLDMEKEDQLLDQLLHSRSVAMEKLRAGRQDFILVASLLDRIPNLAGLARTCEVFKAASLAIADTNILHDKQFQLISVTAEKWVPIVEVPVNSVKVFLEKQQQEGFSILGLEQTANSIPLDQFTFPKKTVLVLGREKEGIPVELIHILDACIEIPQLGVIRSLNVHVSGAIALWEYTRQQRTQ